MENKDKSNIKAKTRTKRGTSRRSKEMDSIVGKTTEHDLLDGSNVSTTLNQSNSSNIIVPPDVQKAREYIVRPL